MAKLSPAMQQYHRFKERHPGCVLFFRMGDFYELFYEDAVLVSKTLGLTLTQRTEGVPMAGMPYHQLETYLRKALAAGLRVAVADQIQDPKDAKGVVDRAVTRVVTSGTLVDDSLLDDAAPNRLAAVAFVDTPRGMRAGLAVTEASTGSFVVLDVAPDRVGDELVRRGVRELLYPEIHADKPPDRVRVALDALGIPGTPRPAWHFRPEEALEAITTTFGVRTLDGFGLSEDDPAIPAAGAVLRYLKETQTPMDGESRDARPDSRAATLAHLRSPRRETDEGLCVVDSISLRALEVERTIRPTGGADPEGSLLGVFLRARAGAGACRTAMGRRLLRDWLCAPLGAAAPIEARQRCVAALCEDRRSAAELGQALDCVQDVARIAGRIALARATPRDLCALGRSLGALAKVVEVIAPARAFAEHAARLAEVRGALGPFAADVLARCVEVAPAHLREGGLFRDGVDAELDEARLLQRDAGAWLAAYQARLVEEHRLPGCKVGYNSVFGYYIELTQTQVRDLGRAIEAAGLTRKQTLRNAERYITPELKEFEEKVTTAEARAVAREQALFRGLCDAAAALLAPITAFADLIAELDALLAFADKAAHRAWRRPEIVEGRTLTIHNGRHPVLDELLGSDFVPNDVELGKAAATDGSDRPPLALLTGPNMAGKSTFIRQVALLTLLAHTGSFLPADRATIGLCDRIFTRVGADDALHRGQSTFMVEMTETANILNHATARSLVILDEIGRGTSTLDGLSLAWAIAEHLAGEASRQPGTEASRENGEAGDHSWMPECLDALMPSSPRTLFATHYHELTELEEQLPGRVANLQVAVREWTTADGHHEIVFMHRIVPGRADQSYGLHVAKLAGLPRGVLERAREVLGSLSVQREGERRDHPAIPPPARRPEPAGGQLSLFTEYLEHPALIQLRELKLDAMTPMQAFDTLRRLLDLADGER
ncbi:MAG TPA: DNA mismatch repair protein MutS [Phycisphaerales bacterium]|nr:DNA mismatch repair protein MutS [Phycisphaerales bacterium]